MRESASNRRHLPCCAAWMRRPPTCAANRFPVSSAGHDFMGTGMSGACVEIPVDISSRFNVLGYPNGGYLTRLAAETLGGRSAHPDLLSINASFLGHPVSGPATARIIELGSTKSLSRATLSLMQDGDLKAFYVATFTDFSRTTGASASHCAGPQLPVTPYHACVRIDTLAFPDPMRSFISQFNLRLAPGVLQNSAPESTATIEGWIALDDEASSTLASLTLFADAFPPPIYNIIDRAEWQSVPTIEYAVHVKANPGPGPIHARFLTKEVRHGLLVIDGELRDMDGQLVAESRQLAKFRGTFGTPSRAS
ncbi:thioesterase family protein [Burkholderia lata]|uniref:thioesterase family protein n=1 Tax=Burkholderia lata (strain ATCC 17760 / DSM 23089 / LMG 22485 / NCIMB 9086 / R18194 / 383) TaxID=482957 RepID=UPI00242E35E9|nr:thioesterase family protein [Burkholderia lata]